MTKKREESNGHPSVPTFKYTILKYLRSFKDHLYKGPLPFKNPKGGVVVFTQKDYTRNVRPINIDILDSIFKCKILILVYYLILQLIYKK